MSSKAFNCNRCGQLIKFDNAIKSAGGRVIPLNMDGSRHDCPAGQPPAPAAPKASEPAASAPAGPMMSLTEFDLHIAAVAKQMASYLTSLAPYSRFTITIEPREPRK